MSDEEVESFPGLAKWRTCSAVELGAGPSTDERMALVKGKVWPKGSMLSIAFLDGSKALQERVIDAARHWLLFARQLQLAFGAKPDRAVLRITFDAPGASSVVGTDAKEVPQERPTMKLGLLGDDSSDEEVRRVTLHEFGHALGCIHEHQNPAGGIPWNKKAVYAYYARTQGWTKAKVDTNLFKPYDANLTVHTAVDLKSIMMYPIAPELTDGKFTTQFNTELSESDKTFIARHYG